MQLNWLDSIGDRNPQLFRELKGRLKPRTVVAAIALAVIGQLLLSGYFYNELPLEAQDYSRFCLYDTNSGYCQLDNAGAPVIYWQEWWLEFFKVLNWLLILLLMLPGAYMLVNDIDQEERRGTLNFIRLSPQSAYRVLTGKLIGVPILLYLIALTLVPLHLVAAWGAGAPVGFILSFYLILTAGCYFLYSAALLSGFLGKVQTSNTGTQTGVGLPLVIMVVTLLLFVPTFISWNLSTTWNYFGHYLTGISDPSSHEWFFLPIAQNPLLAHAFILFNLVLGSYWVWQAIERCFHNPAATLLSKKQTYSLVAYVQVLMLGFCLQHQLPRDALMLHQQVSVTMIWTLLFFLVLIGILSPHRQTLLDWSRFRHLKGRNLAIPHSELGFVQSRTCLMQDLMFGEKSPAPIAILINLMIVAAILLPWVILHPGGHQEMILLGMLGSLNAIAIYALMTQMLLLLKTAKRSLVSICVIVFSMLLPVFALYIIHNPIYGLPTSGLFQFVSLLTPVPLVFFQNFLGGTPYSTAALWLGILGQWTLITLLSLRLTHQLNQMGHSASKVLLAGK